MQSLIEKLKFELREKQALNETVDELKRWLIENEEKYEQEIHSLKMQL